MNQRLLVMLHGVSRHPLRSAKFKLLSSRYRRARREDGECVFEIGRMLLIRGSLICLLMRSDLTTLIPEEL